MPSSLRELYSLKQAESPEELSAISRSLYERDYLVGSLTGARVDSGGLRNYLLGITKTPQDISYETAPPLPVVNAKTLSDDLTSLLNMGNELERKQQTEDPEEIIKLKSAISGSVKEYEPLLNKLDDGTITPEELDKLNVWVRNLENPVGALRSAATFVSRLSPSNWLHSAFGVEGLSDEIEYNDNLQSTFQDAKDKLLTKIAQKGSWVQGKKAIAQEAAQRQDMNLYNDYDYLVDFNSSFKPDKINVNKFADIQNKQFTMALQDPNSAYYNKPETLFKGKRTFLSENPFLQNIVSSALEAGTIDPGTELFKVANSEEIRKGVKDPTQFYKSVLGESATEDLGNIEKGLNVHKKFLEDALQKKAAYFVKVYEKAAKENDEQLQNVAKNGIEKIQLWFKNNNPDVKVENGFLNTVSRTAKTFGRAAASATKSTINFINPFSSRTDIDRFVEMGETPIAIPLDINSDGKTNNLDLDYYGNPVFSDRFHYRGQDGEWKTNWAGLPEVSSRVIGQMVPTLIASALTEGAAMALLPEAAAGVEGITAAANLTRVQRTAQALSDINKFKVLGQELRILDRVGTFATVTASTYDMMVDEELMYTKDINTAKSRGLGRATIEGMTEMIGVPVFGIFRTGKFGIGMSESVQRLANATLPGALTRTERLAVALAGMGTVGKRVLGQSIAESSEEIVADLGNYMMTSYIKSADKGYQREDELSEQSLKNTFSEAFFSMLPFTGVTNAVQSVSEFKKGNRLGAAQWSIANNPDQAISYIKSQQENGKIDAKEAQRRVNEVNKLTGILNSMEDIGNVKDLRTLLDDHDAQRRYFNQMVYRANLSEIDYDSLTEEQKTQLNRYTVLDRLGEKGKKALAALEEKKKALTDEELSELTALKAKSKKTEEETKRFEELSGRGQLSVLEQAQYKLYSDLSKLRLVDRTSLKEKDYKAFVDAGIIKQEDLQPKVDDLNKQIQDADASLYKYKELASKYENMSKEDKDALITNLFEDVYTDVRNSNSATQLQSLTKSTKNQLKVLAGFNSLNPLDYNLREKLAQVAEERFAELVTVNENGVTNLAQQLIDEDLSQATVADIQGKLSFLDRESTAGYVDNKTAQELEQEYLERLDNEITLFNQATEEEKIEKLITHFEAAPVEHKFELETLRNDWTVLKDGQPFIADIDEDLFNKAQTVYFARRQANRAAGNVDASVSATPPGATDISAPVGPGVEAETSGEAYDQTSSVYNEDFEKTQESAAQDKTAKLAQNFLNYHEGKGYKKSLQNYATTLAATFAESVNTKTKKGLSVRPDKEVHKKIVAILQNILLGKTTLLNGLAALKVEMDKSIPATTEKNKGYRSLVNDFAYIADGVKSKLENLGMFDEEEINPEDLDEEDEYVSVFGDEDTTPVNETPDIKLKEAELEKQLAQVQSWTNPLRTAAFDTDNNIPSQDPARVRNAAILERVQKNPTPLRQVQVSSREFFYKQILGVRYNEFVERLKEAIAKKDTSEETLEELQDFFGGDFFAVLPTVTGTPELIYLIENEGKGLLTEPTAIVTFTINGEVEMFDFNGKNYPFYANLTAAKKQEEAVRDSKGLQGNEVPTVVQDFERENPEEFREMVQSGLDLLNSLRQEVTTDVNKKVVVDLARITRGNRPGTEIKVLEEVEQPIDEITFKSKEVENNGLSYPGNIGSGVAIIEGEPHLLFNRFVEEVGGKAEIAALAELIYNAQTREQFFEEPKELIDYIANHYNIFQAGGRKLEFSLKKGQLEVFSVEIKKGKPKKFTKLETAQDFIDFMSRTDTPGIRYNVSKNAVGSTTVMFTSQESLDQEGNTYIEVIPTEMSYEDFVRKTHKVLISQDKVSRNKQVVLDEQSVRNQIQPKTTPVTAPTPASPVVTGSAPASTTLRVEEVQEALSPLSDKTFAVNPENKDTYIEVDEAGNKVEGSPLYKRISTLKPKEFNGPLTDAADRGTIIDSMLRGYLGALMSGGTLTLAELKEIYYNHPLKEQVKEFSDSMLEDLFNIFTEMGANVDFQQLIPSVPTLWGTINGENFAGTIDILGITSKGTLFIIDLKTSSQNRASAYAPNGVDKYDLKGGDSAQLSGYAELLRQRTGIQVDKLVIFPIQVNKTYTSATLNKNTDGSFGLEVKIDRAIFPETTKQEATVSDIEAKKADIERTRQESIKEYLANRKNANNKFSFDENTKDELNISNKSIDVVKYLQTLNSIDQLDYDTLKSFVGAIYRINNTYFTISLDKFGGIITDGAKSGKRILITSNNERASIFVSPNNKVTVAGNETENEADYFIKAQSPASIGEQKFGEQNNTTGKPLDDNILKINAKYDAERASLEAQPEVKPTVQPAVQPAAKPPVVGKPTLTFPEKLRVGEVVQKYNAIMKAYWENLPEENKGKVVTDKNGIVGYYYKYPSGREARLTISVVKVPPKASSKEITISFGEDNVSKILAGTKGTTLRSKQEADKIGIPVGEKAIVTIGGQKFVVTNMGEKMASSPGLAAQYAGQGYEDLPTSPTETNKQKVTIGNTVYYAKYKQTVDFLEGRQPLYFYLIEPIKSRTVNLNTYLQDHFPAILEDERGGKELSEESPVELNLIDLQNAEMVLYLTEEEAKNYGKSTAIRNPLPKEVVENAEPSDFISAFISSLTGTPVNSVSVNTPPSVDNQKDAVGQNIQNAQEEGPVSFFEKALNEKTTVEQTPVENPFVEDAFDENETKQGEEAQKNCKGAGKNIKSKFGKPKK
jgi:hypothetical protein